MFDKKNPALGFLSSLEVAIAALLFLIVLVVMCTLEQVKLGTWAAVDKYFRSAFIYWAPGSGPLRLPIFPAGGAVGLLLLLNVLASMLLRVRRDWSKAGIWLIHIGLVLLVLGEFTTGIFAVETQLVFEEGQSANFASSPRKSELAIFDRSDSAHETVFAVPTDSLRSGKMLSHASWPFRLRIADFHGNADAGPRPNAPNMPPSPANRGIGASMVLRRLSTVSRDDRRNLPAAFIEVLEGDRPLGVWLVWAGIDGIQEFEAGGKRFALQMRPLRRYLPFTLTLKDFTHDRYPGTNIPKNFSSAVRLQNPATGEDRDALIYMNHPLRYMGRTFYQSSFGKNDTLSVLQVVENPGWLMPYISFVLMALGLCVHFGLMISKFKPAGGGKIS
ncbi:MAG: hypothetical protein AUJ52_10855 [Elusimicrobia bacterium CG1_02_63_36]|nr:MAG: hypothetical protein AUJ52_10855 [Elusimicrobia bacterium CG1_02_63_36]